MTAKRIHNINDVVGLSCEIGSARDTVDWLFFDCDAPSFIFFLLLFRFFFLSVRCVCVCLSSTEISFRCVVHYIIWHFGDETKWRLNERRLPVTLDDGKKSRREWKKNQKEDETNIDQTIEMTKIFTTSDSSSSSNSKSHLAHRRREKLKNRPFIFTLLFSFSISHFYFCLSSCEEFHSLKINRSKCAEGNRIDLHSIYG